MALGCEFRAARCVIWLSIVAGSLSFSHTAWGIYAPTEGLRNHWALDSSSGSVAYDSTGSQPGTLVDGPVWQPAAGRIQGALEFDGVDDFVSLGTMDIPAGTGLTISLWMKADDFDVPDARLISKSTGLLAADHYWMVSTINSTALRFRLKAGGATTTLATTTGKIGPGKWYHVAVTYDGANMRIYKDGVEVASTAKTGTPDVNASVGAAIGNQPAGAGSAPFDGLIDDVRIYNRALTPVEISAMAGNPQITLWYGDHQDFGQLGVPQRWVNILGTVTGAERVDSLYYSLNSGPPSQLNVGPDGYRLVGEGDFNVEIDYADLDPGANDVLLTAVDIYGQHFDAAVTVNYTDGVTWARPDTLRFESAAAVTDEACVVDGRWHLEAGGVRTDADAIGYDRLLTAGQGYDAGSSWPSEVEVLAPITIHDYVSTSGRGAIGIGLGWRGHSGGEQPALGHKYEAIAFIRDVDSAPILALYRVDNNGYLDVLQASTPVNVSLGVRYLMRMRSEAVNVDSSLVSVKVWEDGTTEPAGWSLQSRFATVSGAVLLISHYAETTFGNTIVRPLTLSTAGTPPAPLARLRLAQNVPNPFGAGTTIRFQLSEAASAELDVYDVLGRRVHHATLPASTSGWNEYRLDASDLGGRTLPAGIYFYTVRALGVSETRKMTLIR